MIVSFGLKIDFFSMNKGQFETIDKFKIFHSIKGVLEYSTLVSTKGLIKTTGM
jgi:hypothetical protein